MSPARKITELLNLKGRKAIVVGGGGHIGRVVCQALRECDAKVAILDLETAGDLCISCDLRDEKMTRCCIQELIQELGGLDILIHCAAYVGTTKIPGWGVPFEKQTVGAWEEAMRVNLTSIFVIAQEGREALRKSGHGSVVLFSSIYGLIGPDMRLYENTEMANPAAYNASKGGILQLTRYLATLMAPHIRVNAISPGGVWRGQPQMFQERYVQRTPLKRMATEEDMKGAIAYLASDLSEYVTGQNLVIDGGFSIW